MQDRKRTFSALAMTAGIAAQIQDPDTETPRCLNRRQRRAAAAIARSNRPKARKRH